MSYPLKVRKDAKDFHRVTKDALKVIWAKAKKWKCRLIFEDKARYYCNWKLKKFYIYILSSGLFIRVHDSHVARKDAIVDYHSGLAVLCNGKEIPVSRKMTDIIKQIVESNRLPDRQAGNSRP